ncbi:MAG: hypothetical protein P8184_18780, partial [Calditrichia bacterium]
VTTVEEKAEDMIDLYLANEWDNAQTMLDTIVSNQSKIMTDMQVNQMPPSTRYAFNYLVYRLQRLSADQSQPIQAGLAANEITSIMIDLAGYYVYVVPLEVSRMDYLGREIVMLAQVKDNYGLLNMRISQMQDNWNTLAAIIRSKKGEKIAEQVDTDINRIRSEKAGPQMINDANDILNLVDEMEALFQ